MISKNFIKSSMIYTLAGALPLASAVILLPFYIAYLPTEVYGALAICLSISALIQIITTYSFDSSLYIHYHELKRDQVKLNAFVSSCFIFMTLLGFGVVMFLAIVGQFIMADFFPNSTLSFYPFGFIAVVNGVLQAIFKVYGNLLQTREKPVAFFWSNVIQFLVVALTTLVGLKIFPASLIGPLGGRLLALSISFMWVAVRIVREYGFHAASPWRFTSASFNAYTFVYQIQQWVMNYIDRFIILFFMPAASMASVGIYEFAIKCLAPIELILNGLNASVFPQVIKRINEQDKPKKATAEINRYFYGQISVIMVLICGSILILPWILPGLIDWFSSKGQYKQAVEYLPYLAVIFVLRTFRLYFVIPINVLKKMKQLTSINFFVSLLKVGLTIFFISSYGIFGVIVASGVAYFVEIMLAWIGLRMDYQIQFNWFKLIVAPAVVGISVVVLEPLFGVDYPTAIHLFYGLLCGLLLALAYRNEIKLVLPINSIR